MNWLKRLRLFEAWFRAKVVKAPEVKPVEKPVAPSKPDIITDDPSCEIVIKCGGREVRNVGQVTYIKRSLTCTPFDGHNCVGVQYDITGLADGERTVFVDKTRRGIWQGVLPTDIPIGKVVCWYE
jgi:hypothetical protein